MTTANFQNLRQAAREAAERHVARRAQDLRNVIVQKLSAPGGGRTYGVHTASAPGQPPAVDTGRLRQSIRVQKVGPGHYRVGTDVQYAIFLEFGTRRIAARPFLRPSVQELLTRRRP